MLSLDETSPKLCVPADPSIKMMTVETTNTTTDSNQPIKGRTIDILTSFDSDLVLKEYIGKKPFVLRGVASEWPVMQKWSYEWIRKQAGDTKILAYNYNRRSSMSFLFQALFARIPCTLETFFDKYFQKGDATGSFYSIKECVEVFEQHPELLEDVKFDEIYLGPQDIPRKTYFWIGNADSSIGLHADICLWSCLLQIHGRKHWKFYPPHDKDNLYMETKGTMDGGMYSPLDVFSQVDLQQYPRFAQATEYNLILEAGDIIYVPSDWWHAVYSMTETMSVNYIAESCNTPYGKGYPIFSIWAINDAFEFARLVLMTLFRMAALWFMKTFHTPQKKKNDDLRMENSAAGMQV